MNLRKKGLIALYAIYLLFVGGVSLVVGELMVRVFVPKSQWVFREASEDWMPDKKIGWVNRPGINESYRADGVRLVKFRTDLRGVQFSRSSDGNKASFLKIAIFGDSTVVGRVVPEDSRLGPQLQRLLEAKGVQAEIHNAGVQGYSTDQEILLMDRLLPEIRPDWVILMTCENDMGGNESSCAYGWNKPRFTLSSTNELVYHAPESANGAQAGTQKQWIQKSALYRYLYPWIQSWKPSKNWQEENLAGRLDLARSDKVALAADWDLYTALLKRAKEITDRNRCRLVATQHPSVQEVWMEKIPTEAQNRFQERLKKATAEAGVTFVPVLEEYRGRKKEGPFHLLPRDGHCNEQGYRVMGEILAKKISEAVTLPQ